MLIRAARCVLVILVKKCSNVHYIVPIYQAITEADVLAFIASIGEGNYPFEQWKENGCFDKRLF